MKQTIDITGNKYNRLTAIKLAGAGISSQNHYWLFRCECGNTKRCMKSRVMSGYTKSCGCIKKESIIKIGHKNKTHGMEGTKFYKIFQRMKERCDYKKKDNYFLYGGRGIKCLWNKFQDFKNDMYKSYLQHLKIFGEKETTIDRIDVNGNYCKENCRWATLKEQCRNKRNNHFITFNGKTQPLVSWAEEIGISPRTLRSRLVLSKWSIEKSLTPNLFRKYV